MEEFLKFYNDELKYLRKQGETFSSNYPQIAGHLFSKTDVSDPFVSRLLESFAFLTARLRYQFQDETGNVTNELIRLFCPHYFLPMPAFGTVQFLPKASLDHSYRIPRGTEIELSIRDSAACRFTTGYNVTVLPVKLTEAVYNRQCLIKPQNFSAKYIRSCLKFRLQSMQKDLPLQSALPNTLRFFIHAELKETYQIYELLMTHVKEVVLKFKKGDMIQQVVLPVSMIQSMSFLSENSLLPFPRQSFSGFQLLSEFFYYPEKFFYIDLKGFSEWLTEEMGESVELYFLMDHLYSDLESVIDTDNFLLGCCPVINLFEMVGEPIRLDYKKEAYQIIPDLQNSVEELEVYRIQSMTVIANSRKEKIECVPFGGDYFIEKTQSTLYWHESRKNCFESGAYQVKGDEVFVRLTDKNANLNINKSIIIEPKLFCTNRDKASQFSFSAKKPVCRFNLGEHECVEKIKCVQPIKPACYEDKTFKKKRDLIAHLQINYCGFAKDEENLSILKQVLLLHAPDTAYIKMLIEDGLLSVQTKKIIARYSADLKQAFCYGIEYLLAIDSAYFSNNEIYLFGEVISEFLSQNCAMNTFVELVLVDKNQEEIFKWPVKFGRQATL